MIYTIHFQCGCAEQGLGYHLPRRCPMHGSPRSRGYADQRYAAISALGTTGALPPLTDTRPRFYPYIEGMKTWRNPAHNWKPSPL